jgi:serine/threonine protein phosphatase PrpC
MASDGLWDVLSSEDAVDKTNSHRNVAHAGRSIVSLAAKLRLEARTKEGMGDDDIMCFVVDVEMGEGGTEETVGYGCGCTVS